MADSLQDSTVIVMALGRVEGKLDGIAQRQTEFSSSLREHKLEVEKLESRLSKLENARARTGGIAWAAFTMAAALSAFLGWLVTNAVKLAT